MVKKIVALAISLVLSIGALVSYNLTNNEAVEFGEGAGVSRTINNVSELSDVLSKIPSFEEYSENADISAVEGKEAFSGITVVETGYVSNYSGYRRRIAQLPNTDSDGETLYKSRNQELKNHRLEMSFAKNAVYYHSIGTMWTATEYYVYEEPQDTTITYTYSFYHDDFAVAYREKTDYDVEIYHAQDKSMFKINKYETATQRSTKYEDGKMVWADYAEEDDENENENVEVDPMTQLTNKLIEEMLKIREDTYGVWIEYPRAEEGEGEPTEPDFEGVENMTEEQQKEFMINMMVQEFSAQLTNVAYQDLITVQQAHASNKAYLGGLSGYIATNASNPDYFTKKGNSYRLNGPKYVQPVYDPETGEQIEEGYTDYSVPDSYMAIVNVPAYHGDYGTTNTNFDFNVGADMVSINQKVDVSTKQSRNEYNTNTTIMYIDNTVVNLSKNAKIKSLDDAYVKPFDKVIRSEINKMYDQLQAQQGGND